MGHRKQREESGERGEGAGTGCSSEERQKGFVLKGELLEATQVNRVFEKFAESHWGLGWDILFLMMPFVQENIYYLMPLLKLDFSSVICFVLLFANKRSNTDNNNNKK